MAAAPRIKHRAMLRAWIASNPKELRVIAGAVVMATALIAGMAWSGDRMLRALRATNFGFGHGWQCSDAGQGEPVCVKNPAAFHPSQPAAK